MAVSIGWLSQNPLSRGRSLLRQAGAGSQGSRLSAARTWVGTAARV